MPNRTKSTVRQGRIYHFSIDGTDYDAFIWSINQQFCGRVLGQPQVPQCTARTASLVCNTLADWMKTAHTDNSGS
ncbi:MAG: hypothetical protein AAGF95_01270 [Chloroflexota bacterium]